MNLYNYNFFQEDKLGISVYKVSEIIRRADVNKTGQIDYKVNNEQKVYFLQSN